MQTLLTHASSSGPAPRATSRLIVSSFVALSVVVALTGCSPEWGQTKQWLSQQPGVASVDETEGGPPFLLRWAWTGTLRADLESGMSDEAIVGLADAAAEHLATQEADWMSVELADGTWAFRVESDHDSNAQALSELRQFQREEGVVGARIRDDFIQLITNRPDAVSVYRAHVDLWADLLVTSGDEVSASIRTTSYGMDCSTSPALDFAEDVLSDNQSRPSSWYLSVDPCGEIEAYVPFDDLVASAQDLRARTVASPDPGGVNVTVNSSPTQDTAPPQISLRVSDADEEGLKILELVSEPSFGSTSLHAYGSNLSFRNADRTVCELLETVRGAPGIEQYEHLELDGDEMIGIAGPREAVVDYVDSHTSAGGCNVVGRVEL